MNKLNVGVGYRRLRIGEKIKDTDEFWYQNTGPWTLLNDSFEIGKPVEKFHYGWRRKTGESTGWNVTFATRKQARVAAKMSFKEAVLKGPHKE